MAHKIPGAILFDLDGTLIDHFEAIYTCYAHTLGTLGLPIPDRRVIRGAVGGSMKVTTANFVPAGLLDEAIDIWTRKFDEVIFDGLAWMPGAETLVHTLAKAGRPMGILTNKLGYHARQAMEFLGAGHCFQLILGAGDTPFRKPEEQFTRIALGKMNQSATDCVLIGDSPFDLDTGRAVGMPVILVSTGTHSHDELRPLQPDGLFFSLEEAAVSWPLLPHLPEK